MYIMALNCGSSSLKYQIFDMDSKQQVLIGLVEKIGLDGSYLTQKYPDGVKQRKDVVMKNHDDALTEVVNMLRDASIDLAQIGGVGHRVVLGGEKFASSVEINDEVINTIRDLSSIAPLHNPANLTGIIAAKQLLPNAKQVAVFDTAFYSTLPKYVYRYAVPSAWYHELGVRKYGFHGTSHLYVSKRAAKLLNNPKPNLITLHIGSGASATAIRAGVAVDTSMGMTPLAGLTMGSRPGDIDAGVIIYIQQRLGLSADMMQKILNKESGHIGLTQHFQDRRDLEENRETHPVCQLALDIEANNAKKYIGSYMAELGHVDAIVFTAGVGENDDYLRARITSDLEGLGIKMDMDKNAKGLVRLGAGETEISASDSKIKVFMIPTNEELVIVEDTIAIINGTYNPDHMKMKYSFN